MQPERSAAGAPLRPGRTRRSQAKAARIGALIAGILLCSALVPGLPILIGVLLVLAVALYTWTPDLQPFLQPILRVPVGAVGTRRARLLLTAVCGGLLMVSGAVGATTRGHLRSRWEQDQRRREVAEQDAARLMLRVQDHIEGGDVQSAELALMEVERFVDMDAELRAEFAALLERVQRSGDRRVILSVLVGLSPQAFEEFETSRQVPAQLEFPERALTLRAVAIALEQLENARRLRARS